MEVRSPIFEISSVIHRSPKFESSQTQSLWEKDILLIEAASPFLLIAVVNSLVNGGGGGGGFFLTYKDYGRMFHHSFPTGVVFFFKWRLVRAH